MKFIEQLKIKTYPFFKNLQNHKVFVSIGSSKLLKLVKDRFLYKNHEPIIVGDLVSFENMSFYFEAPIKVMSHAKKSGLEARITRFAMSQLTPGSVAIDVGANYGFITLAMAKRVLPDGKVLSFEPDPQIFKKLRDSVTTNDLQDNCILINRFAGKSEEDNFVTIDQILTFYGLDEVDFVKIDVDGGDYDVLFGAKQLLSKYHPPLVIEMGQNQYEIYNFLKGLGYTYFMGMEGETVVPPDFPPNLFASITPLVIPVRGSFK